MGFHVSNKFVRSGEVFNIAPFVLLRLWHLRDQLWSVWTWTPIRLYHLCRSVQFQDRVDLLLLMWTCSAGMSRCPGVWQGRIMCFFSFLNLSPNAVCIMMTARCKYNLCDYVLLWTLSGRGNERACLSEHLWWMLSSCTQTPKYLAASAGLCFPFSGDFFSACLGDLSYPPCNFAGQLGSSSSG